jgi:hypothetical protein
MEPVITVEGYKVLQNPEESRRLLSAYYETLGFHVKAESSSADKMNEVKVAVQPDQERG